MKKANILKMALFQSLQAVKLELLGSKNVDNGLRIMRNRHQVCSCFFDWNEDGVGQDSSPDHVGIVKYVENGRVYVIGGNSGDSGDSCKENSYPIGNYEIHGYACPAY